MSDFNDRPLVAGSVTGLRAFRVDSLGRLVGVTHADVFRPGVNKAECHRGAGGLLALQIHSAFARGGVIHHVQRQPLLGIDPASKPTPDPEPPPGDSAAEQPAKEEPTHRVGSKDCSCGFYAYFDGSNSYATDDDLTVAAVIRGTGVVTVGQRGFRAEKGELLGLVAPSWRRSWRLDGYLPWSWLAVALLNAGVAVWDAAIGFWWGLAINLPVLAFCLFRLHATTRTKRDDDGSHLDRWNLVRRNYPDVPVYPNTKAALRAHPLTPPSTPTPEDPDFRDRPVSA